jgi:hypothetical protein
MRTPLQRYANDFDADLYGLMAKAETLAQVGGTAAPVWLTIALKLAEVRPSVRKMMHKVDLEETA